MSEFRDIGGTVELEWPGGTTMVHALYCYGGMPFLFVRGADSAFTFLRGDGSIDKVIGVKWRNIGLPEHIKLEPSTVMAVRNIARETAKRLGVKQ